MKTYFLLLASGQGEFIAIVDMEGLGMSNSPPLQVIKTGTHSSCIVNQLVLTFFVYIRNVPNEETLSVSIIWHFYS